MKKIFPKKRFDRPVLHSAICNKCGATCEVPFKPNGKKPIYCSNCFRKDDTAPRFDHSSASEKPPYRSTPRTPRPEGDDVALQLKMLNAKVDRILKALDQASEG